MKRSDVLWRFACGDVSSSSSSLHLPLSNSNSNFLLSYMAVWNIGTVYVHGRAEGYIGLYISNDQEISHVFRDVPRAKPKGHLEGQGKSWGQRGCTTQYIPIWGSVWPFSQYFIFNPTLGIYQEIYHYRAINIGSVKSKKMYPSALGKSLGLGKCISQYIPPLGSDTLSTLLPCKYHEIHHYIDCVKINTSPMMIRECAMSCGIVRWDFRHFV